jgi:uncharacterized protein YfkK (UPF0435 family)
MRQADILGGENMDEQRKKDLDDIYDIIKNLDANDVLLVQTAAKILKARQDLEWERLVTANVNRAN